MNDIEAESDDAERARYVFTDDFIPNNFTVSARILEPTLAQINDSIISQINSDSARYYEMINELRGKIDYLEDCVLTIEKKLNELE